MNCISSVLNRKALHIHYIYRYNSVTQEGLKLA